MLATAFKPHGIDRRIEVPEEETGEDVLHMDEIEDVENGVREILIRREALEAEIVVGIATKIVKTNIEPPVTERD